MGVVDQSLNCLDTMRQEGLRPNVITYAAVMTACKDRPSVVLELLDQMNSHGIATNTVLLTSAINSLARGGNNYTGMMLPTAMLINMLIK